MTCAGYKRKKGSPPVEVSPLGTPPMEVGPKRLPPMEVSAPQRYEKNDKN